MPKVAALLYPEALATSVTLPQEILHAAAQHARAQRRPHPERTLQVLSAERAAMITLHSGLSLAVNGTLSPESPYDLLILPAIWRHPERVQRRLAPVLPLLRTLHAAGTAICSVGSASHLLAAAGLLDDRPATTHWRDFDTFATRYPRVRLKRRHLITRSGTLYCVGSVNSIADLMVHLVSQWFGDAIARSVEAQFSPEARQAFDGAAFIDESGDAHQDALIRELQDHLQENLAEPHNLDSLARQLGLAPRSLSRRFQQATGRSPMAWLRERRLREARSLLQHSDLPITEIGWRCGYSTASRFSQAFRADQGMGPRAWRTAVRGKRFAAVDQL